MLCLAFESKETSENPLEMIKAQAETKINHLIKQVHSFHDELVKKNKQIELIGNWPVLLSL